MTKKQSNAGFTLIEIVLVIFLVAICGWVASDLFINQNRLYQTQTAELNITGDARMALDDIDNYVRLGNRVIDSYSSYTTGSQVLVLRIQAVNASNQLVPASFDTIVYYLSGGGLYRQIFPDGLSARDATTKKLAGNVNSLSFTYNNASNALVTEVTTNITLQEDAGIQNRTITISSKSTLRNY